MLIIVYFICSSVIFYTCLKHIWILGHMQFGEHWVYRWKELHLIFCPFMFTVKLLEIHIVVISLLSMECNCFVSLLSMQCFYVSIFLLCFLCFPLEGLLSRVKESAGNVQSLIQHKVEKSDFKSSPSRGICIVFLPFILFLHLYSREALSRKYLCPLPS